MGVVSERWEVVGDDPANLHVVQADAPHLRVCFLTSNGPTEERAQLISAAPDLATELKNILPLVEWAVTAVNPLFVRKAERSVERIRAALSKAGV